jgi:glyoxylase-like metal-dependent hydrolase (beta-lactamase superfamily II)
VRVFDRSGDIVLTDMGLFSSDVRYSWKLLRAGPFRLDSGAMFGIIPRPIWSKVASCDEQGRILLAHNCLLLERRENSGVQRILIETGSGDKFDRKTRQIFGLEDYSIIDALKEVGCSCDQIDSVIVSHLHFDHAGGLTRRGDNSGEDFKITFSSASVIVQRQEWDDALANRSVMTRSYIPPQLAPIRPQLHLIESPPPFAPGSVPDRNQLPPSPLADRITEPLPGIYVFRVTGHTWGQQAIAFTDETGQIVVFTPDLIPTIHHVGASWNMAYDVEPYISTVNRRWFLAAAVEHNWLLVLDHEPGPPRHRVQEDGDGWYRLISQNT